MSSFQTNNEIEHSNLLVATERLGWIIFLCAHSQQSGLISDIAVIQTKCFDLKDRNNNNLRFIANSKTKLT